MENKTGKTGQKEVTDVFTELTNFLVEDEVKKLIAPTAQRIIREFNFAQAMVAPKVLEQFKDVFISKKMSEDKDFEKTVLKAMEAKVLDMLAFTVGNEIFPRMDKLKLETLTGVLKSVSTKLEKTACCTCGSTDPNSKCTHSSGEHCAHIRAMKNANRAN